MAEMTDMSSFAIFIASFQSKFFFELGKGPATISDEFSEKRQREGGEEGGQRPQKSELSGWQLSTRKNFPDEVRKSFSRQKVCVNRFCNKKCA